MGKYFFTLIIFVDKKEKLDLTLESLCQGHKTESIGVQIIFVDETNAANDNCFTSQLEEAGFGLKYLEITEENREQALELALGLADGEYINISKSGVLYQGDVLGEVYQYIQKKKGDRILLPAIAGSKSATMKEINAFANKHGADTDLEKNYHLIHCNYYAYFIKKNTFTKESCTDQSWTLAILKKIFYTLVQEKQLGFAPKAKIYTISASDAVQPWTEMLKTEECYRFCRDFLREIFEFAKKHGDICKANICYNLMYYCSRVLVNYQPDGHVQEIRELIEEITAFIGDDEVILMNQYLNRAYKFYMEEKFCWESASKDVPLRREEIRNQSYAPTIMQFLDIEKDLMVLECKVTMYRKDKFRVYFQVNDKTYEGIPQEMEESWEWFGEKICQISYVKCEVPLPVRQEYRIKVYCEADGERTEKKTYRFGKFVPLSNDVELYYQSNGWNVYFDKARHELVAAPEKKKESFRLWWRRTLSLLKENNASRKSLVVRAALGVCRLFKKNEIWLISDRTNRGDDNGEIFFQYICKEKIPHVNPYYVISKDVPDFERMKQYGKVVPVYSWKHKMLHLLCDFVVSSQANKPVMNPFGAVGVYYKDIIAKKKIVFLQHGVIKDDLSGWLNRYNRNLYGFVVTTKPEYDSILDYDYYYTPKEVWLTGLPRHDALIHNEKNYITVMPTWRKTLSGGTDAAGVWKIGDDFAESNYFKFYNELLNHERLLTEAKKYGYQICFMPHPNVKPAMGLFTHHPDVIFWDETKVYREAFAESNLLVTDYSSAVFDFAYLRKPIIYCQFDREEFFSGGHSYVEGYYNYLEDGFGEVEENLEALVERIIEYMENGCALKEKYAKRIDKTFAWHDRNCCKRVLDKIQGKTISPVREK